MKAILTAPVDLFWNGGIGTYVKASSETNAEVGDKSNDAIRVNGRQLRCRVVGEGGNLGLTQRGRIEYALAGGRIYTDFIDNSAGVDCSDHEVNIKILLGRGGRRRRADRRPERDELLAEMTDEVAELVLRDNYDQATRARQRAGPGAPLLPVHRRMISELERSGSSTARWRRCRPTRSWPPGGQGRADRAGVRGAARVREDRPGAGDPRLGPARRGVDHGVWSTTSRPPLRERFADRMAEHRLRREIVTTSAGQRGGQPGRHLVRLPGGRGDRRAAADVLRAYVVVREVFGLRALWRRGRGAGQQVPPRRRPACYLDTRRLLDRAVRWLVTNRRSPIDVPAEIARLRPRGGPAAAGPGGLFHGSEREAHRRDRTMPWSRWGCPRSWPRRPPG